MLVAADLNAQHSEDKPSGDVIEACDAHLAEVWHIMAP